MPFLLRGTLYDPADVRRFDGQELHFIASADSPHILAVDDRAVMDRWWQFSLLSENAKTVKAQPSGTVTPTGFEVGEIGGGTLPGSPPAGPGLILGGHSSGTGRAPRRTVFYEHIYYRGSDLEVDPGRGHHDLTEVAWTFFGTGDWNDTISSFRLFGTARATLYEHVDWAGSTFTSSGDTPDLTQVGWNDRASGCATW
jgi:hypothetical protein